MQYIRTTKTFWFVFVGICLLSSFIGYFIWKRPFVSASQSQVPQSLGTQVSVFEEKLKPIYVAPTRLFSEERNINVDLIHLGVDSEGALETPKDWQIGGWYKKSSKPGEIGNMIINAHYDDNFGQPAAFWGLKNIEVDDTVYVVDEFDKTHAYKVFKVFHVNISDPNRLNVLDDTPGKATLTLITCGGVWLPKYGTYNERLVVQAIYVESF